MTEPFFHIPAMCREVTELLAHVPSGTVVDATVGAAGHALAILESREDLSVLGIDRDAAAIQVARAALARYQTRAEVVQGGFENLDELAAEVAEKGEVVAVIFDLGVSSPQLDFAHRGFSFRALGPLDMRMDSTQTLSAAEVVNNYEVGALATVIRKYGEERFAKRIANTIAARRPITTTAELAEAITDAIPAPARRKGGHPAKRTFQAIRIEVNDELGQLSRGLDAAEKLVAPGGRVIALSYHSLEDRIVKRRFAHWCGLDVATPPSGPLPILLPELAPFELVTRGALRPTSDEVAANPRARSARLRAAQLRAVQ